MEKNPALQLLGDLWADFGDPDFVWQVLALTLCLAAAFLVARWWRGRNGESRGRLNEAGSRLAFPLIALSFVALAKLGLKPFIHVNLFKVAIALLASLALVRGVVFVLRQAFPRATWLATGERLISALVWTWMAFHITDLSPYVVEMLEQVSFTIGKQRLDLWMILHGLLTVFLTVVVALWLASLLEKRLMGVDTLDSNLRIVSVRIAKALLTVLAIVASLSLVGIDMTALSVFTGALGVGLGLGLQKIASNYVSGFIILLDRSVSIGNVVQVGTDSGMVTQITTRYTVLRHPGGTEYIVPNETFVANVVQNQTYSDSRLRLTCSVGVAYDSDLDLAMRLMVEVASAEPRVLDEPPPKVFLTQFADSAINLELGFWIADPEEGKGNIISDINLAIWRIFRVHGVTIPFPQREVRILNEKPAD